MTYRAWFERRLGKAKMKKLSAKWHRHIARIDSLPKPVKIVSSKRMRELIGVS